MTSKNLWRSSFFVLLLLTALQLLSCMTPEKMQRKVKDYLDSNEQFAADQCSKRFPVIPSFTPGTPIITDPGGIDSGVLKIVGDSLKYMFPNSPGGGRVFLDPKLQNLNVDTAYWYDIAYNDGYNHGIDEGLKSCPRVSKPQKITIRDTLRLPDSAKIRVIELRLADSVAALKTERDAHKKFEAENKALKHSRNSDILYNLKWAGIALLSKWWFWMIVIAAGAGWYLNRRFKFFGYIIDWAHKGK